MKQKDFTGIVPAQYTGKEIEAEASRYLENNDEARVFYEAVKARLLNVNNWHKLAGFVSAHFQLADADGLELARDARKGDYLRIDIPGPGSKEGDGYDWVCVEEVKEMADGDIQSVGFRVRPSQNPLGKNNKIAHFYSNEATSIFIVTRYGKKISSLIIDRNIKPNEDTESLTDKIRNTTVGMGAISLFSKAQWQNLADALVKRKA